MMTCETHLSGSNMNNNRTSRAVAAVLGITLIGVVFGVGVYLPFYSSLAKSGEEARRQLHTQGVERTPGGVWKNLNEAAKHNQVQKPTND